MSDFFSILKHSNLSLRDKNFIILKHISQRLAAPTGWEQNLQHIQADSRPATEGQGTPPFPALTSQAPSPWFQ